MSVGNWLYSWWSPTVVHGTGGDDVLLSYDDGSTTLIGGAGNDIYWIEPGDTVQEDSGGGIDWVFVSGDYVLPAGAHVEILGTNNGDSTRSINLTGNDLINTIVGNNGFNVLRGAGGNDHLRGLGGNDVLDGGAGNDKLGGGAGGDRLYGGEGNDVFIYDAAADSSVSAPDSIRDFATGDSIRLSAIDANSQLAGDQAFTFIGSDEFSNAAGELQVLEGDWGYVVQGDVDGDGQADFAINVSSNASLTAADFVL